MQKLLGQVRRCMEDYDMVQAGETVAVGVSGGKDSLGLLLLLAELRSFYPKPYRLEAITLDLGFPGMDFTPVEALCKDLDVPFTLIHSQIGPLIFDERRETNPCSLCAKMRRGALHEAMLARDVHTIALGHHKDDAVETFMMSLLYEGRLSCFWPVTHLDRTGVKQIRPLLYVGEMAMTNLAREQSLPVVENTCPADNHTRRQEIKELIADLSQQYPDIKSKIFGSMQRLPLPAWGFEKTIRGRRIDYDGSIIQNNTQTTTHNTLGPDGTSASDSSRPDES